MICLKREKRSRASVELWERAQKLCLVRALLRAHSRENRSTSFASCTWLSMDLPTRGISHMPVSWEFAREWQFNGLPTMRQSDCHRYHSAEQQLSLTGP